MQIFLANRIQIKSSGVKKIREITFIAFLITASFSMLISIPEEASAYTFHDPILIDGNSDFTSANGVTGGSGTALDPYIIEGWEIDSLTTIGMYIKNSNCYFIIRNVYIHAFTINVNAKNAIEIYNVTNACIKDSILMDSKYGIVLENVNNTKVENNEVSSNNFYGVRIKDSSNMTIISNNVSSHIYDGIQIVSSYDINITDNNISWNNDNGICPWSSSLITISGNNISYNKKGIFIRESDNITVVNNNLPENDWAIDVFYSENNKINYNNISQNNEGILIRYSEENKIGDNNIDSNIRHGVQVVHSINTSITGNTFSSDGVTIYGDSIPHFNSHTITTDNLINDNPLYYYKDENNIDINNIPIGELIAVNCTGIRTTNLTIFNTDIGIQMAFVDDVLIADSNIQLNDITSLHFDRSTNLRILNNNLSSNIYSGAYFIYSQNIKIMNNNLSNSDDGISGWYSSNITISKCNISLNRWIGIDIAISTNITISSNSIFSNDDNGVQVGGSTDVIIKNNTISWNRYGIEPPYCTNLTIIENYISFNFRGIFLSSTESQGIFINGNNISNNNISIYLFMCANITISENNITSNTNIGIYLRLSTNIRVFHNNIINNPNQATDDNSNENQWDNGYPSGGNYWSDYTGIDLNSTPNQNVPPPDGIGDTPYVLDADSQDNFPLMEPYTSKTYENYTILKQGWNLISLPLIQTNQNLIKVLEMIDGYYDAVQWYEITDTSNPWKHNKVGKPYGNDLFKINETMGLWIHITQPGDTIFLYNGTQLSVNQTITLYPGWNLVGYPSLNNKNRTEGLNNLTFGSEVDAIWTHNTTTQKWKEIIASDNFEVGRGYWIHAKAKVTWIVPI
jgi:parallel beta-helix repeat protein